MPLRLALMDVKGTRDCSTAGVMGREWSLRGARRDRMTNTPKLKLHNTLSGAKELFVPLVQKYPRLCLRTNSL